MEDLEIGCSVVCISGIKSGLKSREDALQDVGVVVDYIFDVHTCQIMVEVDWGETGKSKHLPESLEVVEGVSASIH